MSEQAPKEWKVQKKPALIQRRYDFSAYAETRLFLDLLTQLSETSGYFPDLNFGKTHVNVSVAPQEGELGPVQFAFAEQVDTLAESVSAQPAG
ncbi:MAG: 4a-hydroxytetrahydrobiopterin dehydratase [Sulfurimicrobium sp.]|nr:4a-hydroxytetrahydrobiopterin dehydratase [Sulfurimicrobium sp.]